MSFSNHAISKAQEKAEEQKALAAEAEKKNQAEARKKAAAKKKAATKKKAKAEDKE